MRDRIHLLLLGAALYGVALAATAQAQAPVQEPPQAVDGTTALRTNLADPAFRLRASQGGGKNYLLDSIPAESRQADYDWLRANAKPSPEQALECRLIAWLARDLKRPADEIQKADDMLLQAAPDLPEGWLNRAEFYQAAVEQEPEKAAWALDTFAQGLRRVNFATHDWRASISSVNVNEWFERAAKAGKLALLGDALGDALRSTPRGEAMLDVATYLRGVLQSQTWLDDPSAGERLLEVMAQAQPHLALGDAQGYIEMARAFEIKNQRGLMERVARLLALAPVPEEVAAPVNISRSGFALQWNGAHPAPAPPENATPLQQAEHEIAMERHDAKAQQIAKLRAGWVTMELAWEDTMPRYLPMTQARELLMMAVGDDTAAFADAAMTVAKEQPWNEGLISYALVSSAITDSLFEDALAVADKLDAAAHARLALRLHAFAPTSHLPHDALGPWMMDGAKSLLSATTEGKAPERDASATLLQTLDAFERAKDEARLEELLALVMNKPPRVEDADQWKQLSTLVVRHGSHDQVAAFSGIWAASLDKTPEEPLHLAAISAAAVRGGVARGKGYADLTLRIWTRHYAEKGERTMEDAVAASRVAESLLACEDLAGFSEFVLGLQKAPGANAYATFARMTKELVALQELLSGEGNRLPAVDAWVQAPAEEGGKARVQWRFVLPELDSLASRVPPIRIQTIVGGRDAASNMAVEESDDARWWAAGTSHPLLRNLAGRFDLTISAGDSPAKLRSVAELEKAADKGSVEVSDLPESGCIRVMLRTSAGATGQAESRLYSLRASLFETGREPDAIGQEPALAPPIGEHPSPVTWTPRDDERWGRLIGPPIAIEDGTEYLLTQFAPPAITDAKAIPAQLILLDERQRPLGPVPLVSTGFHAGSHLTATYTQHFASTQRFRASDWGWAEDVVCLREKTKAQAEQTVPARYMAFVSRSTGEGQPPLLQLRRYREPVGGTGAESSGSSDLTQMPELNGEYVTTVGFRVRAWHITMGPERAIFTGEGRIAGFDVGRIPWKPLMRVQSHLILGNEWPMCFASERALIVEPSWTGDRRLGLRFVPFGKDGENYIACERKDLPLKTYSRGELSINHDGALMMVASENREKPEPAAAWLFPDGRCSVCPLPRPPLTGNPGLDVAWWGPEPNRFTLHEDGMLFELEITDELRLVTSKPGSPEDMPPGATPPKSKKKPQWRLERPDILTEHDTTTGVMVRRFHLPQPCEARPMSFNETSPVFLYTTSHEIIRVNPPPRKR
jgi:hypothetical protein